ncbi:CAF17-like 4Fe-4S cluster assembly/insertion protein YgfZ [Solimonas variicoloris]|uniref:CAF17-like 4Fe-4S cluster assembly/insertion protein YgfZ n=1 Tax=Solimonas variicoloris TaxID=254408 RepID=UPI0003813645|nr:folate-binding protein YgfZ [Solimonas variicoloris]
MNLLITDTRELAWLRVSGADAETFLQGQLSNDVRRLSAGQAQLSSYNSPKGRMLAVLHLVRSGDDILIELPRAIADATLARLKMFVLRAKVAIAPADDLDALALIGDDAPAMMPFFKLPVPAAPLQCLRDEARGLTVVRRLGRLTRFTVLGPREAIAALRAQIPEAMREPEGLLWRRADIDCGIPVVLPETRDHFVAQMANLDLLGGISFDKGCYTGQEIVARLHYLGQLKRRLFTARIDGPAPAPGTAVHAAGETQAVGEIVDAVPAGDGAVASLVLQLGALEAALRVGETGASLTLTSAAPAA